LHIDVTMRNSQVACIVWTVHVTRTVVLPVSTDEAWELLTDPDELAEWLVDPEGVERHRVVEEVVEGQRLGFVWWSDDDDPSRVAITVEEADDGAGALVTVTETAPVPGWEARLVDLELRCLTRLAAFA
jgi:uncharacterized protein YndB with AHSA1/START domain